MNEIASESFQQTPANPPLHQAPTSKLRLFTALGAAALFAFGVFCWVAANWAGFSRFEKLGLIGGVLAISALAAASAPRARAPLLLVTTSAVGGLLALIGQIYPSGADAWELFAAWAALALPFALAARHDAVWSLWTLVAAAAIGLWQIQETLSIDFGDVLPIWALALALAAIFWPSWPVASRLVGPAPWAFRLASLAAVAQITVVGVFVIPEKTSQSEATAVGAICALALASAALIATPPVDIGVLGLVFAGIDTLLIARMFAALKQPYSIVPLTLVALVAAAIVAGSVWLLRTVHRRSGAAIGHSDSGASWPLAALSAIGAVLASVPFILLYSLVFSTAAENPVVAVFTGGVTLGVAVVILRGGAAFGFRQMFSLIAIGVGMALVGYAALKWFDRDSGFLLAILAAGLALAVSVPWMRALFGFVAMAAVATGILAQLANGGLVGHPEAAVALVSIAAAAGGVALAVGAARWPSPSGARPFFVGWSVAGLFAMMLLAGRPFLAGAAAGGLGALGDVFRAPWSGPSQAVSILLGFAGVTVLLARRADLRTLLGFAVAACAVGLTPPSPTLGAVLAIFACALLAGARGLAVVAVIAAIWVLSAFYYALDWTLTQKAYVLMGLGAALGVVAIVTGTRKTKAPVAPFRLAAAALSRLASRRPLRLPASRCATPRRCCATAA